MRRTSSWAMSMMGSEKESSPERAPKRLRKIGKISPIKLEEASGKNHQEMKNKPSKVKKRKKKKSEGTPKNRLAEGGAEEEPEAGGRGVNNSEEEHKDEETRKKKPSKVKKRKKKSKGIPKNRLAEGGAEEEPEAGGRGVNNSEEEHKDEEETRKKKPSKVKKWKKELQSTPETSASSKGGDDVSMSYADHDSDAVDGCAAMVRKVVQEASSAGDSEPSGGSSSSAAGVADDRCPPVQEGAAPADASEHSGSSSDSAAGVSIGGCTAVHKVAASADPAHEEAAPAEPRGSTLDSKGDVDGWVVVAEMDLNATTKQRAWLAAHVGNFANGRLQTSIYTGRKLYGNGPVRLERTKPTPISFGRLPELEPEWSSSRSSPWTHTPGLHQSEANFNFQRVRVTGILDGDVHVVVEWNPALALHHMAASLGVCATEVSLSCKVAPVQPPGWQPEPDNDADSEEEGEEFSLRGCQNERTAAQPPRFRRFPLRREQLRSLRWMLDREAKPASFTSEVESRYVPGVECFNQPSIQNSNYEAQEKRYPDFWKAYEERSGFSWCYEPTLKAKFDIAGGVLGDAIGTGKTATLIGLLDSQRASASPPTPHEARHLFTTSATLILVPSNLLGQWQGEFMKFLGPDAFKCLVISSIKDLKAATVQSLMDCEIVLTTFKVLYSVDYVERLKALMCTRANCLHERSFLGAPIEKALAEVEKAQKEVLSKGPGKVGWTMRNKTSKERDFDRDETEQGKNHELLLTPEQVEARIEQLGLCKDVKKMPHPVFELFFWRRIVFDEFHELEAMDRRRQCMLQNLRSHYRWGLTGTPPKRDKFQIGVLAKMLRLKLMEDDHVQCQLFLDTFVRQNFSELPEIPVKEHIIFVEQTPEERAIYLQQAFDGDRQTLLQFCSHHCIRKQQEEDDDEADGDGGMGRSARSSVESMEKHKQEKHTELKELVTKEYLILAALSSGCKDQYQDSRAEAEACDKLSELEAQVQTVGCPALNTFFGQLPKGPSCTIMNNAEGHHSLVDTALGKLDMTRPGAHRCAMVLRAIGASGRPLLIDLHNARASQLGRCHAALGKLLAMTRSLRFFQATLSVLRGANDGSEAQECPVCLESMPPETAALLPCAHAFHIGCIGQLKGANSLSCPTCRAPFQQDDGVMIGQESSSHISAPDAEERDRFGSKLTKIAQTLKEIRKKEPHAKAIVFVQWKALEALVGETLQKMGIDHIRLQGATKQRSRLIAQFQEQPTPWVLLQSLENSASGANLTRASHVLLVHPMDACSHERAVAYEMQALGRVRRCGQEAKEVHLYRFVTKGTVEEDISKEHQVGVASSIMAGGSGQSAAASSSSAGGG